MENASICSFIGNRQKGYKRFHKKVIYYPLTPKKVHFEISFKCKKAFLIIFCNKKLKKVYSVYAKWIYLYIR